MAKKTTKETTTKTNILGIETRTYHLMGITPLLGSQPSDPNVRASWIATKAPDMEITEAEIEENKDVIGDKGVTIFLRDVRNNDYLFIYDYTIRAFIKNALNALKDVVKVTNPQSKVTKNLFVYPRMVYIGHQNDEGIMCPITEEDDMCERPLRAQTAQGPRNALASSEMILDPWDMYIQIKLIPEKGSKNSAPLTWDIIEACLDYGELQGIGQWRNASMGRFTWDVVDELPKNAGRSGGGWAGRSKGYV